MNTVQKTNDMHSTLEETYEAKPVFNCDICGIDVFEDETYYVVDETYVCKECKTDYIEATCKRRA